MNYSVIPLFLIITSLTAIIILIIRKFPQLTLMDIEGIPEVKEERRKNELLKRHAHKKSQEQKRTLISRLKPVFVFGRMMQQKFRAFVVRVEEKAMQSSSAWKRKRTTLGDQYQGQEEVQSLLRDAQHAIDHNDLETAEMKYIAAIRIDARSADAYQGLADVYYTQKHVAEAKETYAFLLQLKPNNEHALLRLGDIAEEEHDFVEAVKRYEEAALLNPNKASLFAKMGELLTSIGDTGRALGAIERAVALEEMNPKYLDALAEVSILVGDKAVAEDAYRRLRMVNPDNNKLPNFKERIAALE